MYKLGRAELFVRILSGDIKPGSTVQVIDYPEEQTEYENFIRDYISKQREV